MSNKNRRRLKIIYCKNSRQLQFCESRKYASPHEVYIFDSLTSEDTVKIFRVDLTDFSPDDVVEFDKPWLILNTDEVRGTHLKVFCFKNKLFIHARRMRIASSCGADGTVTIVDRDSRTYQQILIPIRDMVRDDNQVYFCDQEGIRIFM